MDVNGNERIRGNKAKIRDALLQAMEDYVASGEDAIARHKATNLMKEKQQLGIVIEKCHLRIKQLMDAVKELDE